MFIYRELYTFVTLVINCEHPPGTPRLYSPMLGRTASCGFSFGWEFAHTARGILLRMTSKLTFHGGAGTVTGANFLFQVFPQASEQPLNILLDCGLLHGAQYSETDGFGYDPATMDVLVVSHAHADHIGKIPKLVKDGFRGVIYSTPATKELSEVMLADAQKILAQEALAKGKEPMYTPADIEASLALWKTVKYHTPFSIGDMTVTFKDAGHILGSAITEFKRGGKVFMYTGDLGNTPDPLLRDTELPLGVDYLLMESVYGDRNHEERSSRSHKLAEAMGKIAKTKGTLLIPAFSLQRTQMILYEINNLVEGGTVPSMPVYLDSPLGSRVTDIFRANLDLLNDSVQLEIHSGDDIFSFPKFVEVHDVRLSSALDAMPGPKVILSSSGMSVGGRILSHEAGLLGDDRNIILFVGYQAVGTLGRRIQEGHKKVRINDKDVKVHARTDVITGYSGHKDSENLIRFVEGGASTLKQVFVALGEPRSSTFLAQRLRDYVGVDASVPEAGETITLDF